MRITLAAGLVVSAVMLAGCGGGGPHINPDAKPVAGRWNATLARPAGLRGALQVSGMGWMVANPKEAEETEAYVSIENASPGGERPWHVHRGQCGSDQGIFGLWKLTGPSLARLPSRSWKLSAPGRASILQDLSRSPDAQS